MHTSEANKSSEAESIGVIGAGSMGQALIAGWVSEQSDTGRQIIAVVRDVPKYAHLEVEYGIRVTDDRSALAQCGVVVLAIKPQVIREILAEFAPFIAPDTVVISIAAGITTEFIAHVFTQTDQIIRAMPNTPSIIGQGVTGISGSPLCSRTSLDRAAALMSSVGAVVEIPESQQNDLAAVSGSGPAYLFYLAEYMLQGALDVGLPRSVAEKLVRETLLGSAALLAASESTPPHVLREQVTSPAGMTAAAMQVLDDRGVGAAIRAALARGTERAHELGAP